MRVPTVVVPVLLVAQLGLAQPPEGAKAKAEERLDLRVVNQDWGTKVPDPANPRRFELHGHTGIYYLGPVMLRSLDEVAKRLAAWPNKDVALIVRCGQGVTLGDVVAAMDAAKQAGFTHLRLGGEEGTRLYPDGRRVRPSHEPLPARVELAEVEALAAAGIVPPLARNGLKPGTPQTKAPNGWPEPDGRVAPIFDVGHDGRVQRDGKRIRDPEPEGADRLAATLEAFAAPRDAGSRPSTALVIRADLWTEVYHIVRIVEACGRTSVPIARVLLGVSPATAADPTQPTPTERRK